MTAPSATGQIAGGTFQPTGFEVTVRSFRTASAWHRGIAVVTGGTRFLNAVRIGYDPGSACEHSPRGRGLVAAVFGAWVTCDER